MLRELGLNIQPQKTSVVTVDKLDPELKPVTQRFLDLRGSVGFSFDYFGEVEFDESIEDDTYGEEALVVGEDIRKFEDLWTEAIDQEEKRTSILSFALTGLSVGASPFAEQYILDTLEGFPNLASTSTKYLMSLPFRHDTADRILSFIESEECIYEWQQMWLLQYFQGLDAYIEPYKSRLKAILDDSNRHPIVRSLISEIIAFKGAATDGEYIKRLFNDESDPLLRRHLLLGFRLLPVSERNHAISYLPPNDWALKLVGQLVKAGVQLLDADC